MTLIGLWNALADMSADKYSGRLKHAVLIVSRLKEVGLLSRLVVTSLDLVGTVSYEYYIKERMLEKTGNCC